jgi:hypothetical protein
MVRKEKEVIRTIYHKDVANFFESMELSEKLAQGEFRCIICVEKITVDNFRAVARKSGGLLFCCDNESCIHEFASYLRGDKA